MFQAINFPTRIGMVYSFAFYNIFVDYGRINSHYVLHIINGLSEHEAQYLVLNNVFNHHKDKKQQFRTRTIPKEAITAFQNMSINENWDEVLQYKDVNKGFNIFLSTFLHKFETSFPMQNVINKTKNNQWITAGIEVYCKRKNSIYILSKTTNSPIIKAFYTQ